MDDPEDEMRLTDVRPIAPGIERLSKLEWRACNNCVFSAKEGDDRVCRFNPPHVSIFMVPGPPMRTPQGQVMQRPQPLPVTVFPVVQPDQWCGKFKKRV